MSTYVLLLLLLRNVRILLPLFVYFLRANPREDRVHIFSMCGSYKDVDA